MPRVYRANGLAPPYTSTQVFAFSGYIACTGLFYASIALQSVGPATGVLAGAVGALSALVIACYFIVSVVDPAEEARTALARAVDWLCAACYCFGRRYREKPWSTWCARCSKVVPGLDHHCPWLNTDIGRRNYAAFFGLASLATAQFGTQASVSVWIIARRWGEASVAARLVCVLHVSGALALFGAFGMLLVFHIYLVYRQLTTYDFLIEMRNTQREQQATQAREPAGAVTNADPKRVGQKGAALEITSSTPPLLDAKGDPGAEDAAEAAAGAQTA